MAISQRQIQKLQQTLSPQQIQMIKLLELPTMQLEQRIKQEIEENIVLEEERKEEDDEQQTISVDDYIREDDTPSYKSRINNFSKDDRQRPVNITEGRSLQEYLCDYASESTLLAARDVIATEIAKIPSERAREITKQRIDRILAGERDFRF